MTANWSWEMSMADQDVKAIRRMMAEREAMRGLAGGLILGFLLAIGVLVAMIYYLPSLPDGFYLAVLLGVPIFLATACYKAEIKQFDDRTD